jgi:hypothetical protein
MKTTPVPADINRSALANLLVIARGAPYQPLPSRELTEERIAQLLAPYRTLVRAGYATEAPRGNGRFEYQITTAGRDYLAATRVQP